MLLSMDSLLSEMAGHEASDLLLTVGSPPQLRVRGLLRPIGEDVLDDDAVVSIAHSILNESQKSILDTKKSLDLSISPDGTARYRINIYRQKGSLAMAIRIIPCTVPPFEELGLPPVVRDFSEVRHGLVLITGPAGSGKSTTLAAMINHINSNKHTHIVCVEDPIEYLHVSKRSIVDQREIPADAPSFASAMRDVFRQSPDVIMVGEMRDLETIRLALTLAETGHLILATLHTHDATHSISRIVDSFPAEHQQQIYLQISMVLQGVIAQQLVPVQDEGRLVLVCEVLRVNQAIRHLIRERHLQQVYSVIQTGKAEGMVTMNDSLRELCDLGFIDKETALRRSPRPKEMARLLDMNGGES